MEIKKVGEYYRKWVEIDKNLKTEQLSFQKKSSSRGATAKSVLATGDRVELSVNMVDYEKSRAEKVARIKSQIEQGSYQINDSEIANRMLEEVW